MLRVLIVLIESKSFVGILTFWQMTQVNSDARRRSIRRTLRCEWQFVTQPREKRKFNFTIRLWSVSRPLETIGHSPYLSGLRDMLFHDGYRSHERVRSIVWGSRSVYKAGLGVCRFMREIP